MSSSMHRQNMAPAGLARVHVGAYAPAACSWPMASTFVTTIGAKHAWPRLPVSFP
jgi:hypothetical protein